MDQYHLAANGQQEGLWDWDLASNRIHFSPRWVSMVGCEDGQVGKSPEEWLRRVHAEDRPAVEREIEAHITSGSAGFEMRHRLLHQDGTYRWVACRGAVVRNPSGAAVRLVGSHADVTADHFADALTGLPNRDMFLDRLGRSVERARRNPDLMYAVLLIDLEPPAGGPSPAQPERGPLLTASARRLEIGLRAADDSSPAAGDYVVARLRGSQFGVLLDGLNSVRDARAAAERLLASLLGPLALRGRQVFPRASIGIALSATGYASADDVLRDADAALFRAKSLGGNRCEAFDLDLIQSAERRLEIEAGLPEALERGQFRLFYQPVVEAASGSIVGLEALARWQHPERGAIPPDEFIPIAERTGFIPLLEHWTLREACRQLKAWQASRVASKNLWVSVNISGAHFRRPGIVERVGEALREADLDPACLVLELTESAVIDDPSAVRTLLMQLRVTGVRIAIDDFGTGQSSFAYLHQFPADFLKVDQSLTRDLEVRQDKADIVGMVAGLAAQLGLQVIAEGIESQAGLEQVRSRQCRYLQGFLFSRPIDAAGAAELLKNGAPVPSGSTCNVEGAQAGPEGAERAGTATRRGIARGGGYVAAGCAALALLVLTGLPSRLVDEPAGPAPTSRLRALEVAQPFAPIAPPADAGASGSGPKRDKAPSRVADVSFAVEHQHVFGGCRGVLRVSPRGLSFTSDNAKDAFSFDRGRFECALRSGTLTIKDGQRTYRFKGAGGGGSGAGDAAIEAAMNAIAALR